jgi:sigma-B regulation protein RsbU (phosphoserine phosphatase)
MSAEQDELSFLRDRLHLVERLFSLKQKQLNAMREVTEAINKNVPISAIARIFENVLQVNIGIREVALFLRRDQTDTGWDAYSSFVNPEQLNSIDPAEILSDFKTISRVPDSFNNQMGLQVFYYIIPVFHKEQAIGLALIAALPQQHAQTEQEQLKFIQAISSLVATANENKILFRAQLERILLEKELNLAAEIQSAFVPEIGTQLEGGEVAAYYRPHKNIGGDYYDIIRRNDGSVVFCIADIAGKGIPAALLMANFQATLNISSQSNTDIVAMVRSMNTQICKVSRMERFITVFLAIYHPSTKTLEYLNAGHNPPLLFSEGKITALDKGCMVLGMCDPIIKIQSTFLQLKESDVLLMFTDGLSEAENEAGDMFENEAVEEVLLDYGTLRPEEINDALRSKLEGFIGSSGLNDDLTLFTVKFS